jgi:hypothetical protein
VSQFFCPFNQLFLFLTQIIIFLFLFSFLFLRLFEQGIKIIEQAATRHLREAILEVGPVATLKKSFSSNLEPFFHDPWRTTPYPKRSYKLINRPIPAIGLSEEDSQQLNAVNHVIGHPPTFFSVCYDCDDDEIHTKWLDSKIKDMRADQLKEIMGRRDLLDKVNYILPQNDFLCSTIVDYLFIYLFIREK